MTGPNTLSALASAPAPMPVIARLAEFSFPLNVYAHLIAWDDGAVDYLHYGLFAEAGEGGGRAQVRASAALMRVLPPPCRLLEIGIGLGTTLARLQAMDYAVCGITPDLSQIAEVRRRLGPNAPVRASRLEDFEENTGAWDAMLFQESAQYIDALDIFSKASQLLRPDGTLVIMDEFAVLRRPGERENMHYWPHVQRWAERAGFTLDHCEDLTKQAAPTIDWLSSRVTHHRSALLNLPGVTDATLDALLVALEGYREKYASGVYAYLLLRFTRQRLPRWQLGRILPQHREEVATLFASVFGHPISPALWDWKYANGRGSAIGVWEQGRLVAHYGGMRRDALLLGRPSVAFQACDFMVEPAVRGTLSRQGPAFLATATFLEHELGYGAPYEVGVGFPNLRAYRMPERLGLYRGALARIVELRWTALSARPSWRMQLREAPAWTPQLRAEIECCWQAMAATLGEHAVGVRDADYIERRYCRHPDKNYRIFLLRTRLGQRPLAAFVLRATGGEPGAAAYELMDVLAPLDRVAEVVHQARRLLVALGGAVLTAWLSDALLPVFNANGAAAVQDLDVIVPGNGWTQGPAHETLVGRWWLMGGDTDFR
ncbi:MAG: GNAT family N-acetyltransferase [Burkholderiales bacterium]|nr:GNAT family N-acetyltransferase [Burkholderiales bacterium]